MRARRVGIVAAAVVGVGLFGSSVHGLTRLDARLADQRDAPAVKREHRAIDARDCPAKDARRQL